MDDFRHLLGYVPNRADARDAAFGVDADLVAEVPEAFALLPDDAVPMIVQAAQSCVGFSVGGIIHDMWIAEDPVRWSPLDLMPSPSFIWRASRLRHEAEEENVGTYLRTAFQALRKVGYCQEYKWRSLDGKDLELFDKQPATLAFHAASDQKMTSLSYTHVLETGARRVDAVKRALASRRGIVIGMMVDSAFMRWNGVGTIDPPKGSDLVGGHAMRATRYDSEGLWLPGTWGPLYGAGGWHHISWAAIASDKVVDVVAVKAPPKFGGGAP